MAKKEKATDWEKPTGKTMPDGFVQTASSGFAPNWIPENKGDSVDFIPVNFQVIESKSTKGKKKMANDLVTVTCLLKATNNDNFYQKKEKVECLEGEEFSIAISYNLIGRNRIIEMPKNDDNEFDTTQAEFSPLAKSSMEKLLPLRIVFMSKIPTGGGRTVKQFSVYAHPDL